MASSKTKANEADFLGEGTAPKQGNNQPARPTTSDGLFFLDTGEPTPLYIRRQQQNAGLIGAGSYTDPAKPVGKATKFDADRGQYYEQGANGRRIYITNDPAAEQRAQNTPIFTVNALPKQAKDYMPTAQGAAMGALAGAKLGGPGGAAVGAGFGAAAALPQASGRPLYLSPGSGEVGGRQGTQAEANQANANYLATGNSTPFGGFPAPANPFPQTSTGPMPTNYQTNQGSNTAISSEAQKVLANAQAMAAQSQQRADSFYSQAGAAGGRAAPQMAMPSSANQQAVYDRAMGFNAQSGAAAIRAERADISGATRLENYQLDQQGINNLEGFRSENSAAGVDALNNFNPRRTFASADKLDNFSAVHTLEGANELLSYNPHASIYQDRENMRNFQSDRSGIDRLNAYADEAQGPSAAQAMLRSQADADKRTQLAIARSGRGVAGSVQAQRQAITEGGLIEAETRGQGAALAAQETEAYKGRQLQALAQAGSLISAAEAQRLTALQAAGQLTSTADQQKLAALQAYGALKAQVDTTELSARQSAGQLNATGEGMKLNATSNAAQLQGQMDAQRLSAISNAAGLRTQGDQIRSNNLQAAGQIRLSGSEINQRGAIAASNADLQAQALNLQSLSLAGQVSSDIRNQDINVLRSNLDASLQTLGLNDQQVRFFNQLGSDREVASQNLQQQAASLGVNAQQAQEALNLQWQQFGLSQLSQQQQYQYQQQVLQQNGSQFDQSQALANQQYASQLAQQNRNNQRADQQQTMNTLGTIFQGASALLQTSPTPSSSASAVASSGFRPGLGAAPANNSGVTPMGNGFYQVFDPFTGQMVTRSGAPGSQTQTNPNSYFDLANSGGNSYGI